MIYLPVRVVLLVLVACSSALQNNTDYDLVGISLLDAARHDEQLLSNKSAISSVPPPPVFFPPPPSPLSSRTPTSSESDTLFNSGVKRPPAIVPLSDSVPLATTGAEVFRLLSKAMNKKPDDKSLTLREEHEFLCNCSTAQCDYELTSYLGPRYANLCLSHNGSCFYLRHKDFMPVTGDYEYVDNYGCTVRNLETNGKENPMFCISYPGYDVKCCKGELCTQEFIKLNAKVLAEEPSWFKKNEWLIVIFSFIVLLSFIFLTICYFQPWRRRNKYCQAFHRWLAAQLRPLLERNDDDAELESIGTTTTSQGQPSTNGTILSRSTSASNSLFARVAPCHRPHHFHNHKEGEMLLADESGLATTTDSCCSGSGSGGIVMQQKTFSYQITLLKKLSEGSFGEVWHGTWKGESVAVKIFDSRLNASWLAEVIFYQKYIFKHRNIVGFLGSDKKDTPDRLEFWLVLEFYPNLSVFEYVASHTLDVKELLRMACTAANGLHYLHTQIIGFPASGGKPAIVHNDLKTKNILVRSDLSCCIGDFGLATAYDEQTGDWLTSKPDKLGTLRYMAPELLLGTYNRDIFESYRQADIYSFALVIYQMLCRTEAPGVVARTFAESHPFSEFLESDPNIVQMTEIVGIKALRPSLSSDWRLHEALREIAALITECWSQESAARLNALIMRKRLESILGANEALEGLV